MYWNRIATCLILLFMLTLPSCKYMPDSDASDDDKLDVLFLGDDREHRPSERLRDITSPMLDRGITLHYTSDLDDLTLQNLQKYDALLLYADYPELPGEQEMALIDYVNGGGGFVAIHSASGNFMNSGAYSGLVGARLDSVRVGEFTTSIAEPDHDIMTGLEALQSLDEAIVHTDHTTENRTVLSYLDDEPHTWVRNVGEGRVFYTAWGHDEITWQNPGFHELLERGIRWSAGQNVQQVLASRAIENPFSYVVLDVPFPPPHEVRLQYEEEVGPMDRRANNPMYYRQQNPMDAEEAIDRMIVPPGFRVELFAAEPDIVNPIYMNWDEQGRLWVIESIEYPYPREFWPDGGGKDRIRILEDTNQDGRADKFTVFAENLNIPTSLAFANGGVIVHQAPQTLFLQDTDGDDRADVRDVLFEGWNQWDTHAGPNNLHYGLDNWIWGVLGYAGMEGTVGGEQHEFSMGVYRFKQDGSDLEFLRRTNNNTWGLGFNEQGDAFISTANGNPSTWYQFPRSLYDHLPGLNDSVTDRLANSARVITLSNLFRQVDWVGAFTAASGHAVYTARSWPEEYWNQIAFVAEPTVQLVSEFKLDRDGSGYQGEYPRNLIASDDEWFSPVMAEVGPDGQIWVADWYNYIIQHNAESDRQEPTPGNAYANPLRDRGHGRIYRIVYEDGAPADPMSLEDAGPDELVRTLTHENMLWRKHAQRLLVERNNTDVIPQLIDLVESTSVDEAGLNVGAIHALWTLHGLGQLDGTTTDSWEAAVDALTHFSTGVRANAVQVLTQAQPSITAILENELLEDENMQVRLRTLVKLSGMPPSDEAGERIFELLTETPEVEDRWIREAAAIAASVHSTGFLRSAADAGMLEGNMGSMEEPEEGLPLEWIIHLVYSKVPDFDTQENGVSQSTPELPDGIDVILELGVTPNVLQFDKEELRAGAGQTVRIVFTNTDNMEHNLLILNPGSIEQVGALADELTGAPDGRERNYVPDSQDVLASTPIIGPQENYELTFTVPSEPGEYPFVCTIPGHWRVMQGLLIVE